MNESTLAEKACRTCERTFPYEPIVIFGRDLAASLHIDCPECAEAGEQRESERQQAQRVEESKDRLRAIIPPDLLETDLHFPEFNRHLWQAVRQWLRDRPTLSLGIIGPAALCKTRVMALLAKQVGLRGSRLVWTSAVRLYDVTEDRKSRLQNVTTLAREHLQDCRNAPWLFLDDIGKNEWSRPFESQLFQILDHRLNHRLPTIWTANDHPEEFSQVITPLNAWPIIGRLTDRCTLFDLRKES